MLDTALGAIVQITVFLWIVGLGISLIIKEQKKYLQNSKKYIVTFVKRYWRYIIVFLLGFLSAYPGTVQLLIH